MTKSPATMNSRMEVATWHRGKEVPQIAVMVDAQTSVSLTPDEADHLAEQLKFHAQFVRHHVRRARGSVGVLVHHRREGIPCPFELPQDILTDADGVHDGPGALCARCFPNNCAK